MEPAFTASIDRPSLAAAAIAVAVGVFLAAWLPITAPEAYAFAHFVRPPLRDLLGAFDAAAHPLSIVLMKRSVGLMRLSAFSLRLPDLAGLALCVWAVAKLPRGGWTLVALAGAACLAADLRFPGAGLGLAFSLWLCALQRAVAYLAPDQPHRLRNLNQAGVCLGLSIAANFCFLFPSVALAAAIGWAAHRRAALPLFSWVERVVVPATVAAFVLLVLPLSQATAREILSVTLPPAAVASPSPREAAALMTALEREARGKPVRISAPTDIVPVIEFYRARDRAGDWRVFAAPHPADYSVTNSATGPADGRLLYQGRTLVLTRSSHAGT